MINTLTTNRQALHHTSVLVGFERESGRILGTLTMATDGHHPNETLTSRTRDRFIADLRKSLGDVQIDTVQVASKDFDERLLSRIDPLTGRLTGPAAEAAVTQRKHQVLLHP